MSVAVFRGSLNQTISNTVSNPVLVGGVYAGSTSPNIIVKFISSGVDSLDMLLTATKPNSTQLASYSAASLNVLTANVQLQIQALQNGLQTYLTGISTIGGYITDLQIQVVPANATYTQYHIFISCFYC
jgi:hypothetical protein